MILNEVRHSFNLLILGRFSQGIGFPVHRTVVNAMEGLTLSLEGLLELHSRHALPFKQGLEDG